MSQSIPPINYAKLLQTLQTEAIEKPQWLQLQGEVMGAAGVGEIILLLGNVLHVRYESGETIKYRDWRSAIAQQMIQPVAALDESLESTIAQIPVAHQALVRLWARQIQHMEVIAASSAQTQPISEDLPDRIQAALNRLGITHLYEHQAEAIAAHRTGEDVYLCTATASGKTLAFQVATIEDAVRHQQTSLMLFPTNALIDDQIEKMEAWMQALLEQGQRELRAIKLVGGMTNRQALFTTVPDFILTNPDVLNFQIGKYKDLKYQGWKLFLKRLKTIVIDEAHYQAGAFGANTANLIRRLRLAVDRCGGNPDELQFVLCSATVRNPAVLAHLLTQSQRRLRVIEQSGAADPGRTVICLKPNSGSMAQVCKITQDLLCSGLSSLVFFNARETAKRLLDRVQRDLKRKQLNELVQQIALFHSSIQPERKQAIIQGLESGSLRQVFSTSALEAGIDIPQLDVSLIWGFPGLSAFRQRSGRSGRGSEPGLTIFIPMMHRSLDYYYATHPDELIHAEVEAVMLNPDYPLRVVQHLLAAAQECRIHSTELKVFGERADAIAGELIEQNLLSTIGRYLGAVGRPQSAIQIRGSEFSLIDLVVNGKVLERLNLNLALQEVFPGALYTVQHDDGEVRQYRSASLSLTERCAQLEEISPPSNFSTTPEIELELLPHHLIQQRRIELTSGALELSLHWGEVRCSMTGYQEFLNQSSFRCSNAQCRTRLDGSGVRPCCPDCGHSLEIHSISQKLVASIEFEQPYQQKTEGPILLMQADTTLQGWIEQRVAQRQQHVKAQQSTTNAQADDDLLKFDPVQLVLHTLAHQWILAMPLHVRFSVADVIDLSVPTVPGTPTQWAILDSGSGGNGASEYIFEHYDQLSATAIKMSQCRCRSGCPQCLTLHQCSVNNQALDRIVGVDLLTQIARSAGLIA